MSDDKSLGPPRLRRPTSTKPTDDEAAEAAKRKGTFQCMGCGALQPRSRVVEVKEVIRPVSNMMGGIPSVASYEHPIVCAERGAPKPGCKAAALQLPSKDKSWSRV